MLDRFFIWKLDCWCVKLSDFVVSGTEIACKYMGAQVILLGGICHPVDFILVTNFIFIDIFFSFFFSCLIYSCNCPQICVRFHSSVYWMWIYNVPVSNLSALELVSLKRYYMIHDISLNSRIFRIDMRRISFQFDSVSRRRPLKIQYVGLSVLYNWSGTILLRILLDILVAFSE